MKRLILMGLALLLALSAGAQENPDAALMARILEANMPVSTLQASWTQVKHSPLLEENLHSEGKVWLRQPDAVRWEILQPVQRVNILNGASPRGRFRLPTEKDFELTVLESDVYSVQLLPTRRDLRQMLGRIVLVVDRETLLIRKVTLIGEDGGWAQLEFHHIVKEEELPDSLFEKKE